jgi:hypothetical protein
MRRFLDSIEIVAAGYFRLKFLICGAGILRNRAGKALREFWWNPGKGRLWPIGEK